jgi:hypothetical protein
MSLKMPRHNNRRQRVLPESEVEELLSESLASVFANPETRAGNDMLLIHLLQNHGAFLARKRAATICMFVRGVFKRRVTVPQVLLARKRVNMLKRHNEGQLAFELSMEQQFHDWLRFRAEHPEARRRSRQRGPDQQDMDQQLLGDTGERSSLADPQLCITCCVRPPNVVLAPCYHHVLCKACHIKYAEQRCPVCRGPIASAHETFGV